MIKFPIKFGILLLAAISAGLLWQQAQLSVLALSRIDPLPETRMMIAEERYAEAADYLEFFKGSRHILAIFWTYLKTNISILHSNCIREMNTANLMVNLMNRNYL